MYNEDLKMEFINSYTKSVTTKRACQSAFNQTQKFEEKLKKDLCEFSTDELKRVVDNTLGIDYVAKSSRVHIIHRYCDWAMTKGVAGANDPTVGLVVTSVKSYKARMVGSPSHLKSVLDKVFRADEDCTTDSVFRSIYWLAFSGVKKEQLFLLTADCIDFINQVITIDGDSFVLYKESVSSLQKCIELSEFRVYNPLYKDKYVWKSRSDGGSILRGFGTYEDENDIKSRTTRKIRNAYAHGIIDTKPTFETIRKSGLFYRLSENERAGIKPNFAYVARFLYNDKQYKTDRNHVLKTVLDRVEKNFQKEYEDWKNAFL